MIFLISHIDYLLLGTYLGLWNIHVGMRRIDHLEMKESKSYEVWKKNQSGINHFYTFKLISCSLLQNWHRLVILPRFYYLVTNNLVFLSNYLIRCPSIHPNISDVVKIFRHWGPPHVLWQVYFGFWVTWSISSWQKY